MATNEDTTVQVTLSATNGTITSWSIVGLPQHGTLLGTPPQVTYRPDADYNGPDSFQYTATSPSGTSTPATISLTVQAVNDPPTLNAIPDVTIAESSGPQSMTLSGLTAGPIDESGQTLSLTVNSDNPTLVPMLTVTGAAGGVATLNYSLLAYASGSALVTVTVHDSGGTANDGVDTTVRTFHITVFPVNDAPTLDPIADLTVLENAGAQTVSLTGITAGAPNESMQTLTISAVTDNPGLLGTLTVITIGANSSIRFTPTADQYGSVRITVTVKDNGGLANGGIDTVTRSFRVTVSFVNQRPTLNVVDDVTVLENSGVHSVGLSGITAGPSSELAQQLTITVSSDNPTVVPTPTLSPITNGNSQLSFTPALNQFGSATMTVTVRDDGGGNDTVTVSFHVIVTAVNQPPTVRPLNDVIIPQNSAPLIVGITGISAGPGNESSQSVTITAVSDNATVVPNPVVASVSSTSSTLTIQPTMNQVGTARVTVTVKDNGGLANGGVDSVSVSFTVTVVPVNQAPTLDSIANVTVAENSGARSITLTGISPGPAIEASQQLVVTAGSSNPTLIPDPTLSAIMNGSATLTFTPALNQNGFAVITVILHDDGGTGSGGQDTTSRTFIVTVTPFVNAAPTLDLIADVTVAENSGSTDISLTGITPGPPSESAQHVTLSATSSNPTLVANPIMSAAQNGASKLTFVPAANQSGFAVITVTVKDDAGTRNNGSDTTTRVFSITVTPFVNQPPGIDTVLPVSVLENSGSHTVTLTGISSGPSSEAAQQITVTAKSNAPGVIPDPTVSPIVNGMATLTFESLPDRAGVVAITLTLQDGGGTRNGGNDTAKQTFAIIVETVNQAPTLEPIADITLNENAGEQTVALTGLTPGPVTEMAQGLTITATSSDPTVVANVVVGAMTGTSAPLTFESLPFAFGSTTITITVKDDGGTTAGGVDTVTRTFVVTVLPVNQPPTVDLISDLIILENAPQQTIVLHGLSTGPENESMQHLMMIARSSNPTLIADPTITPGDLTTLQFQPALDSMGETTITLTVSDDGGVERGGADAIELSFKVTVLPVNHAPTIDPIADVEVLADGIIRQLKITGLSPGPANESMQTLDVSAVSAEDTVATIHGVTRESDGTATLRFIPVGIGTTQITVTVLDNGGRENEGIDRTQMTFTVHASASRKQLGGCGCNDLDGTGRTELGLLIALGFLLRRRRQARTA